MAYLGQQPVVGRYILLDQISGGFNGTASGFTMSTAGGAQGVIPGLAQNVLLSLGGVIQQPGVDYSISGSGLTFTTPPVSGTTFFATVLGDAQSVGTPSDGTVTPASIASGYDFAFPNLNVTGVVTIASGSAASPSLTFTGDLNTGLYSPGADQVAVATNGTRRLLISDGQIQANTLFSVAMGGVGFQTIFRNGANEDNYISQGASGFTLFRNHNGSEYMRLDSSGRLGIGTSSPSDKLDISTGNIRLTDGYTLQWGGTSTFINGYNAGILQLCTGSTPRLYINSSGNVGIGVSSPGDVLHVKGGSTYAGVIADNSAATGGGAFRAYRNGVQKAIFCADSWVTGTSSDDAAIYADAGGGIKFYTNNSSTAKAVLTSGGSLGIGTASPSSALDINGDCAVANTRAYQVKDSGGTTRYAMYMSGSLSPSAGNDLFIGNTLANSLVLYTNSAERARIDSSGRLLVGTSSTVDSASNALLQSSASGGAFLALGNTNTVGAGAATLGQVGFYGYQGAYALSASITANSDATWSSNDYPTRLVFSTTADGGSSPTEQLRITSDRYVRLASGTGGIQFNGDTAAANALDDYEEGTWTPSVGGDATYNSRSGTYTKIGRFVHVTVSININTLGTGSSTTITSLPFAASGDGLAASNHVGYWVGTSRSVTSLMACTNTTQIVFTDTTTAATGTNLNAGIMGNGTDLRFTLVYRV